MQIQKTQDSNAVTFLGEIQINSLASLFGSGTKVMSVVIPIITCFCNRNIQIFQVKNCLNSQTDEVLFWISDWKTTGSNPGNLPDSIVLKLHFYSVSAEVSSFLLVIWLDASLKGKKIINGNVAKITSQ